MPTITKPQVIYEPFCALGTPGTDYIIPVQTSINPDIMTQDVGIPFNMQKPLPSGGVPVDRPQTNGYMYLYSSILAWIQEGGTFTFEPTVSAYYTGYPAGTVLWAASVNNFVVSLVNNNTNNFVTTPSFIDGVHWQTITALTYPDITDVSALVSITGSGGLFVNNHLTVLDPSAADFQVFRNNVTAPGAHFEVVTSDPLPAIPGQTSIARIGLAGGGGTPMLAAAYNGTNRFYQINANPGDVSPTVHFRALAMLGDISAMIPVTQSFSVVDSNTNTWVLFCTSLSGPFPSKNVMINGMGNGANIGAGSTSNTMDLIAAGIVANVANTAIKGAISFTETASYGTTSPSSMLITTTATSQILTLETVTVNPLTLDIQFFITYQ